MKKYRWSVTLGERTVVVEAVDRFEATKEAAKKLGVLWSKVARDMTVVKLGAMRGRGT